MKKIFSLFAVAILGLATVGCVDEPVEEVEKVPSVDGVTMLVAKPEVFAITRGSETSTELESRTWGADAKLGVYGATMGNNVEYKLFSSYAGAAEGAFYGNEVQGELYVYYPYYAASSRNGSKITLPLAEDQNYNADFAQQMTDYNPTLVATTTTEEVTFNYLVGALGVQVQGGALVKKITVSSETNALAGAVAVDFARDFEVSAVEDSKKSVTLDCGEGVLTAIDTPTTFYVMVPPATYNDLKVTVEIEGSEYTKAIEGSYTIARLKAVDTSAPTSNATIVATFDTLTIGSESDDSRVWAENATFGVFAEGVDNVKYVIAPNEAGKSEAVFAGGDVEGDFVAYYPWSNIATKSGDVLTAYMNTAQTYNADRLTQFAENAPFMVANGAVGEPLEFKYINGALGLRCKVDGNIARVDLQGENGAVLSGAVAIDMANGNAVTATAESKNFLTLECGEDGVATSYDNPATLFVCLPAATYNNFEVTLTMTDGSFVKSFVTTPVEVKPLEINVSDKDITYMILDIELEQSDLNCKKVWSADDMVSIYDLVNNRGSNGMIFRGQGVGTAKATFTVPSENLAVIYPAQDFSSITLEGTVASFMLPDTQSYVADAIHHSAMPFVGLVNPTSSKIFNMLSILEVKLTGDLTVNKIVVKSKSKKLSGKALVDSNYTDTPVLQMDATASNSVAIDCGEGFILTDTPTVVNVAIPAATYAANDITIDIHTDMGVYSNMPTACTLTRAAATAKSVAVPQPTSLTATEADCANCFVLGANAKGWYSFIPKTRGGYDRVGNEDIIKENTAAYVLYESAQGMFTNATYVPEKNIVTFMYDGTAGNGGICVADAPDNICWTWHLWCPGAVVKDIAFGSVTLMDRNIGARTIPSSERQAKQYTDLQNLEAAGMIYQMGRPTPFPGAKVWANEKWETRLGLAENTISETFYYPSAEYLDNGQKFQCGVGSSLVVDVAAKGVKNPLYYFVLENKTNNKYWSDDFKTDTNSESYPWNYAVESNIQFDPCPKGYQLPTYAELSAAYKSVSWRHMGVTDMSEADGLMNGTKFLASGGFRTGYGLFSATGGQSVHFLIATGAVDAEDDATTYNRLYVGIEKKNIGGSKWEPGNGAHVRCIKK